MKLAILGIRDIPGGETVTAGSDTFAYELGQRLVAKGWEVTAFAQGQSKTIQAKGITYEYIPTISSVGFNTFIHTFKCLFKVIKGKFDIVHIHNSGNSFIIPILILFGIRSAVMVDGKDWTRDKWKWYAKLYLWLTRKLAYLVADRILFDNVFVMEEAENENKRIKRKSLFIPYGSDYTFGDEGKELLPKFGLTEGDYYMFVGRFVPEKGLQYLIQANNELDLKRSIVLIGGDIGHFKWEDQLKAMNKKDNLVFTGPLYNEEMRTLMKYAFAYIQPSEVEGLSPVLLTAGGKGLPIIASDIRENKFIGEDNMRYFKTMDYKDLKARIEEFENAPKEELDQLGAACRENILSRFSWEEVTNQHDDIFRELIGKN
ncbi:MAG: glycosyltransferase [Bacteroidetes bacterium]|nr:glycosyltransferase [Bacteroidota bacterium]